jgi:hypothetical protein
LLNPFRALLFVTQETRVGAVFLAKVARHLGIGNIVNLMGAGAKHQGIHNARHVAGDAVSDQTHNSTQRWVTRGRFFASEAAPPLRMTVGWILIHNPRVLPHQGRIQTK